MSAPSLKPCTLCGGTPILMATGPAEPVGFEVVASHIEEDHSIRVYGATVSVATARWNNMMSTEEVK